MKKADQVEQAPNSEAMLRRWKRKEQSRSSHLTKQVEREKKRRNRQVIFRPAFTAVNILHGNTKVVSFDCAGINI